MKKSNNILIPEFERLLKEGHMVEFLPRGISMRPFIEGGRDRVILKTMSEPRIGMIVLAKINEKHVLHRIYKIQGEQIILRGDGNLTGYEICTAQDVIGRVALIKNNFGQRKRLTTGFVWRHLPACIKKYYLKIYRIVVKLQPTDYED